MKLSKSDLARSLPPVELFDSASRDGAVYLDTHEFTDHLFVISVVHEVELLDIEIFVGNVVSHHEWYFLSSEHEDALDVEVGFFSKHANTSEGVLAEFSVDSLDKSTHQVDEFVKNGTFSSVLLVLHVPEGVSISESLRFEHLFAFINSFSSLVGVVAVEGLEVEKIEIGLGESLNIGIGGSSDNDFLFDGLFDDLSLFLFLLEDGLESSSAHMNLTVDFHEGGVGRHFLEPCGTLCVDGGFAETSIEDGLEQEGKGSSKDEIGNSDLVSANVLSSER